MKTKNWLQHLLLTFLLSLQKAVTDYKQMFKPKAPSSTISFPSLLGNGFKSGVLDSKKKTYSICSLKANNAHEFFT